jgi:hypothetical protein
MTGRVSRRAVTVLVALSALLLGAAAWAQPRAVDYPMPVPAPPAAVQPTRPVGWRDSTVLGLSSGLGSPYGLLGAFIGYHLLPNFQLEVGGGYSASFGPSIAAIGRAGFNPGNNSFLSLGLGLSTNFVDFHYADNCAYPGNSVADAGCSPTGAPRYVDGSASALWLDVEVAEDVRLGRSVGGRIAAGFGLLLNPSAFPAALGCPADGLGLTPCDAGAARTRDAPGWLLHVRIDLYAVIVHGDR